MPTDPPGSAAKREDDRHGRAVTSPDPRGAGSEPLPGSERVLRHGPQDSDRTAPVGGEDRAGRGRVAEPGSAAQRDDHAACIDDQALGARIRGYIDAEIGEESSFSWGLADLDRSDLFHLRNAVQRYFRHIAAEQIGDALSIESHVLTVGRVGELVAAIEVVEKASGEANAKQTKWWQAEQNRKYHEEQRAMREKAASRAKPEGY